MAADLLSLLSHADTVEDVWFLEVSERVLERPFTPGDEPAWGTDSDEEWDQS